MIRFIIDQQNGPSFSDNKTKEIITGFFVVAERGANFTAVVGTELAFYYARALVATTYKHLYNHIEWFIVVNGEEVSFELTKSGRVATKGFWKNMFRCHIDECLETILGVKDG